MKTEEELIWESYNLNKLQVILKNNYSDKRIILSENNKININVIYNQPSKPFFKPKGLWYALGESWVNFLLSWKGHSMLYNNAFIIDIDYTDILKIDNVEKFKKFDDKYAIKEILNGRETKINVNWMSVSKKYKGIEIIPYIDLGLDRPTWYSTWDIPSGCIWDTSAIKNYNIIKN